MWLVALSLQVLLFIHFGLLLQHDLSLRGEGLEILLLVTTMVSSGWIIFRGRHRARSQWTKVLYGLNALSQFPLWITAILMGLSMYVTHTIGTFEMSDGTRVLLKGQSGLLGCSVHPYITYGLFEQRVYQEEYVSCFDFLDAEILTSSWNSDETLLTIELEDVSHTFELKPTATD